MVSWIMGNLGTIITFIILSLIIIGAVSSIVRNKKQGRSTCGCNCSQCSACAACKQAGQGAK